MIQPQVIDFQDEGPKACSSNQCWDGGPERQETLLKLQPCRNEETQDRDWDLSFQKKEEIYTP